jgi:Uncharacterized protein conserved in archaea
MKMTLAEYRAESKEQGLLLRFRKQNRDLYRYFKDFTADEPIDDTALESLMGEAIQNSGIKLQITEKTISADEICLHAANPGDEAAEAFAQAFLDALLHFYEEHEIHITRMFGSFVCIQRIDGELEAVRATPVPIRYCPLMSQLLKEVGGQTAESLLSAVKSGDEEQQTAKLRALINEVVIKGGYFDTSRPLNSCEANVLFGASETMSTAFRAGLLDAAVIVSNNLGTIITTDPSNTQGAVKRMTGLFLTSPSREIMETAISAKIIPVFPHSAIIDQLEGVKLAISLGFKNIAVSVAWMDNILLNEISKLEKDGVTIYKFGLCSTGIDESAAKAMQKNADLIWSCASKVVREMIEPNAIAQVGVKIPVHIMTEKGWRLVKNHLELTSLDREGQEVSYDSVVCQNGGEKPIVLNAGSSFQVMAAKDVRGCIDCPHPCV